MIHGVNSLITLLPVSRTLEAPTQSHWSAQKNPTKSVSKMSEVKFIKGSHLVLLAKYRMMRETLSIDILSLLNVSCAPPRFTKLK